MGAVLLDPKKLLPRKAFLRNMGYLKWLRALPCRWTKPVRKLLTVCSQLSSPTGDLGVRRALMDSSSVSLQGPNTLRQRRVGEHSFQSRDHRALSSSLQALPSGNQLRWCRMRRATLLTVVAAASLLELQHHLGCTHASWVASRHMAGTTTLGDW